MSTFILTWTYAGKTQEVFRGPIQLVQLKKKELMNVGQYRTGLFQVRTEKGFQYKQLLNKDTIKRLLAICILFVGCTTANTSKLNTEVSKIEVLEVERIGGRSIVVLEYDNHKYITNSDGGIIHIESCQCKTK